jgi:hypothetical protein
MKKDTSKETIAAQQAELLSPALRDLAEQREYEARMRERHGSLTIMVAKAFVLGMRRHGYKNTATALDEFIDNAKQAGASRVDVAFGFDGSVKKDQPTQIAVIDDGHGMDGGMIRLAMMWGGSHRADKDDRSGFGRFGFGLPTAALSQGYAYTVISRTPGGPLRMVPFNVHDLGAYGNTAGGLDIPEDIDAELPQWLQGYLAENFGDFPHGTIVLLGDLDNLKWKTEGQLNEQLHRHFGLYYRNFLRDFIIRVNGTPVKPVDPLFLTEGAEFFEAPDDIRAEAAPGTTIPVKDPATGNVKGSITVRYSYMPYGFSDLKGGDAGDKALKKIKSARFQVLKQTAGIIVTRHGRQIDVIKPPSGSDGWFDWIPRDVYWGVEIDFPASLDEDFNVTTSKQSVTPTERIWDLLKQHGVREAISGFRKRRLSELKTGVEVGVESPETITAQVMKEVGKSKRRPFLGDDPGRIQESVLRFEREVGRRSEETKMDPSAIAAELRKVATEHPYVVVRQSLNEDGPFYRPHTWGTQKQLILNVDHPFYSVFFEPASGQAKAAFLLLLFVLADAEIDVRTEDQRQFYIGERKEWSENIRRGAAQYKNIVPMDQETAEEDPENAA